MKGLPITVILLYFLSGTRGNMCPDEVQLVGSDVVCPEKAWFFRCNTVNDYGLGWSLDGQSRSFFGGDGRDDVGTPTFSLGNNSFAYLVERTADDTNFGNRTSILQFTPDSNSVGTISLNCNGETRTCRKDVVVGPDIIQPPTEYNNTISADGNTTIHTWNHPKEEMVAHYNIVLDGEVVSGHIFHVMPGTRRIEVPRIPGLSYSGRLIAVSICGSESEPVVFDVSSASHIKVPVVVMLQLALLGLWS